MTNTTTPGGYATRRCTRHPSPQARGHPSVVPSLRSAGVCAIASSTASLTVPATKEYVPRGAAGGGSHRQSPTVTAGVDRALSDTFTDVSEPSTPESIDRPSIHTRRRIRGLSAGSQQNRRVASRPVRWRPRWRGVTVVISAVRIAGQHRQRNVDVPLVAADGSRSQYPSPNPQL